MPNNNYYSVLVTGHGDDEDDPVIIAHREALKIFEVDLVSNLSSVGHNSANSFSIFPSGSGIGRPPEVKHQTAIIVLVNLLEKLKLNYCVTYWGDNDDTSPRIIASHDLPLNRWDFKI